ncbi:hypothetical protein [Aestuariibaculum marinum]|uniref:Lipoprotein n=1 Tax=Aestuariibaculum marinum TaxID=2683592 RepID=A0A8J6PXS3_9FLAO|nr:hypothetical protein [Aestuariibaculum marinum]MBD0825500.1 hypothetical protein [Aestuariibaculum marinum]
MMKYLLISLLCLFIFSCSSGNLKKENNFSFKPGACIDIQNNGYKLCITTIEDGRCPLNMNCLWQGNATVYFILTSNHEDISFTLNTFKNFKQDTIINNLKFSLVDVLPYPERTPSSNLEDYTIKLEISNPD